MKQTLCLKLKDDVINGFSYSFCKALLEALKEKFEKEEIFEDSYLYQEEIMQRNNGQELAFNFMSGSQPICEYLIEQTNFPSFSGNYKGVQRLIEHAEKFLSIFEKSKEDDQEIQGESFKDWGKPDPGDELDECHPSLGE